MSKSFNETYLEILKDAQKKQIIEEGLLGTAKNWIKNKASVAAGLGSAESKKGVRDKFTALLHKFLVDGGGFKVSQSNPHKFIGVVGGVKECFKFDGARNLLFGYKGSSDGSLKYVGSVKLTINADEDSIYKAIEKLCKQGTMEIPSLTSSSDQEKRKKEEEKQRKEEEEAAARAEIEQDETDD